MIVRTSIALVGMLALSWGPADAAAHLVLKKFISVVERIGGTEHVKPSGSTAVAPGTRLRITIAMTNDGDRPAHSVAVRDTIQRDQSYLAGSALPASHVEYSADGGKTWSASPTVQVQTPNGILTRKALPAEYTALRWVDQAPVAPNGGGIYSYDVILK